MTDDTDLTQAFPLSSIDHGELIQVFLRHFGHAENRDRFVYVFLRQGHPFEVRIIGSKSGRIRAIQASVDFPRAELDGLLDAVRGKLIEGQSSAAWCGVLFCVGHRVHGYFQYRDRFQIGPLPPDAPQPDQPDGHYAFAIHYPFSGSSDVVISSMRRRREEVILARYLNLLLAPHIHPGPHFSEYDWALEREVAFPYWARLAYLLPKPVEVTLPLSRPAGIPAIGVVDHQSYYERLHAGPAHELAVPDNLEASLDRVFALGESDRTRLERSVSWLMQAPGIWRVSGSASYAALVIAIEALLETRDPATCKHCGQPKYATTKRFTDFLRQYIPGIDSHPKVRGRLYDVRSKIVHGTELFEMDSEPWRHILNIKGDDEMQLYRDASQLVRVAIYNWLWSRDQLVAG